MPGALGRWQRKLRARLERHWSGRLARAFLYSKDRVWLGLRGEDLACRELTKNGYRIVERRGRSRLGEIDIVAREGKVLVFVEVKTRRGKKYGMPAEAVDRRKQRKLIRLARAYAVQKGLDGTPIRFDVVGVELPPKQKPRVRVYRGAFEDEAPF